MLSDYFPMMGLRLRTPRLELRLPSDEDLAGLAHTALEGVHDPQEMPFLVPWTDKPPEEMAMGLVQHNWATMAAWTPENWALNMAVVHEGNVVGVQDLRARNFAVARQVSTGSWVGLRYQRRGLGTEMRAAVLHLAFAALDALEARSGVFEGNTASERVASRLGYEADGTALFAVRDRRVREVRYRLDRENWERHRTVPVQITGLEPCLHHFGLDKNKDTE